MSTSVLPAGTFFGVTRVAEVRPSPSSGVPPSRSVRRNLFGPIDHEESRKFVRSELDKIVVTDRDRWNFDFKAERPLRGRYSWEVTRAGRVPVAYAMPSLVARLLPDRQNKASSQDASVVLEAGPEDPKDPLQLALNSVSAGCATTSGCQKEQPGTCPEASNEAIDAIGTDEGRHRPVRSSTSGPPRKQTKITEFLKMRKRPRSTEEKTDSPDAANLPKRARTS